MFTIMISIILVGLAFVLGSTQPVLTHGVLVQRFEDRWLKFEGVMSGIIFGGMLIAEGFSKFLELGDNDSIIAIFVVAMIIVIAAMLFGSLVYQIAIKSASIMRDRLSR